MPVRLQTPFGMLGGVVVCPRPARVVVRGVRRHDSSIMIGDMKETKQNIRYLGFESTEDGRRFDFSITAAGEEAKRVYLIIPALMFKGANKITCQDCATICYEKIRVLVERERLAEQAP